MALLNALWLALVLGGLSLALLGMLVHQYALSRQRQYAVQAVWNARSGVEHFLAAGQLPEPDPATGVPTVFLDQPGDRSRCCEVKRDGEDLIFRGLSHGVSRTIVLVDGDPNQRREQP